MKSMGNEIWWREWYKQKKRKTGNTKDERVEVEWEDETMLMKDANGNNCEGIPNLGGWTLKK